MSENQKSILVDLTLGLVAAVLIFFLKVGGSPSVLQVLSDSFFVPAVVLLGIGGLGMCTNSGALDMLGYGFDTLKGKLEKRGRMDGGPNEDYFTYSRRKAGERKPYGHYLIAGCVHLVISLIFLALYNLM